MLPAQQGSFRLFRFKRIDVHVHWSWFIIAMYSVSQRVPNYTTPAWAVLEYVMLFVTVTLHEFGHALACRQVGGTANQIVLWPLGGVAYVAPPQRAGATLWSIAAGPLVNVVLLPVFIGLGWACRWAGLLENNPDFVHFLRALVVMDLSLLVFNLLPIYPLDGGQILRSLLWYWCGRARSLQVATIIGLIGGVGLVALAVWDQSIWLGVIAYFLLSQSWGSFRAAGALRKLEQLPRRPEFKCPVCHALPPRGALWVCPSCKAAFDPFATAAVCPHCQHANDTTMCPNCHEARPHRSWDASIVDA
ncbi:MAG: M50 family metallopeptidase [Opitutae bacterium]|nr:M50 family metallopeptidase [Opitutae bacterium]